jgi:hypothetical protein
VKSAQEFLKRIRTLSDDYINSNSIELHTEYAELQVRIPEFENIQIDIQRERKFIDAGKSLLESFTLRDIVEKRQDLQKHKYAKDCTLAYQLLNKEVELLRKEFELASTFSNEFEEKPLFD